MEYLNSKVNHKDYMFDHIAYRSFSLLHWSDASGEVQGWRITSYLLAPGVGRSTVPAR